MPQLQGPIPGLVGLYEKPCVQSIFEGLDDHQFEHFVKYVFEQAGYIAEDTAGHHGQGLDLKLYTKPTRSLHAGVSIKHFRPLGIPQTFDTAKPPILVQVQHVRDLKGALAEQGDIAGYLVTTSSLNDAALARARQAPHIWPLDGEHFVRYINYVRGTRAAEADDTEPDPRLRTNPMAPIPPEVLLAADDIPHRLPHQTKVLTLANHKGGVGKTTTAINLAFGLAALDRQVLLVDMDSQANLTRVLPTQAPNADQTHIGHYFARAHTLSQLIRQTRFPRVWLIPSSKALSHSDAGIAAGPGTELRFVRDLHAKEVVPPSALDNRPFDWIILDTGPWMGLFTRSALAASHFVIMPVAPSVFADLGSDLLVETVETMTALTGQPIKVLGGLVTHWQDNAQNRSLLAEAAARLQSHGLDFLQTKIPYDKTNIERAFLETGDPSRRGPFRRRGAAAEAYKAVVEVL